MAISIGLFLTIPMRIYGDNMFEMTVRWIPESCGRRRWIGVNQSIFLIFHVYLSSTWGDGPISSNFTIFQTGLRPPKRTRGPLELISRNRKTWRDHATDIYIYIYASISISKCIYIQCWLIFCCCNLLKFVSIKAFKSIGINLARTPSVSTDL